MRIGTYIPGPLLPNEVHLLQFSYRRRRAGLYAPYARAVEREISEHVNFYAATGVRLPAHDAPHLVDTIYMGGGTPSLLDPADLKRILQAVRSHFQWEATEVTLEADPETITATACQRVEGSRDQPD